MCIFWLWKMHTFTSDRVSESCHNCGQTGIREAPHRTVVLNKILCILCKSQKINFWIRALMAPWGHPHAPGVAQNEKWHKTKVDPINISGGVPLMEKNEFQNFGWPSL